MNNYQLKIDILTVARRNIKSLKGKQLNNYTSAICRQLTIQYGQSFPFSASPKDDAINQLKSYISDSLGYNLYLEDWLRNNLNGFVITPASLRKARIEWIDWMITQYEAELKKVKH